ncbi:MAG TPA: cytochrome c [Candidatus Limnocylindrales bacterium]|nr:cytochrome c [Candidatus Limnocylindrales bacterium]
MKVAVVWGLYLIFGGVVLATQSPLTQNTPSPGSVVESAQLAKGRELFKEKCARCHGPQGQGTRIAPALVRTPHPLGGYKTAAGLFTYVSKAMPFDAPGSLKEEEYWAVVAFLADANRLLPDKKVTLGPANAESIRLDVYPAP